MSVKLRTVVTAALTLILAAGVVVQSAPIDSAFATESGLADTLTSSNAQANASGADAAAESATDATGGISADADSSADATADAPPASATADTASDANGEGSATGSAANGEDSTSASAASAIATSQSDSSGSAEASGIASAAGSDSDGADAGRDGVLLDTAKQPAAAPRAEDIVDLEVEKERQKASDAKFAGAAGATGFRPGYIISDANFYSANAMTETQIQAFLETRMKSTAEGRCTIGSSAARQPGAKYGSTKIAQNCLKDGRYSSASHAANAYCKAYQGGSNERAARIIDKVSKACGISARVLLITLEKEQSLITDTWPTERQLQVATGYACPDSGPGGTANCNSAYFGFGLQMYYAAWQQKLYKAKPTSYNYRPFRFNTIQYHPNTACGTSSVYIENYATAALYIYTPYRPNNAALAAGWGTGDACSTYGIRNFSKYYNAWFGSPTTFFPDVPENHKFFTEIEWMGTGGLSTGVQTSDGRAPVYQPKNKVTREAMAAFLYRLEGSNYKGPAKSPFTDVKKGDKFYNEIAWMHKEGLSTGIKQSNGTKLYAPKENVSREAMAAFIYRLKKANYNAPANSPFVDMKKGDKFYREIAWMYKEGLSTGIKQANGAKKYEPKDRVSREAMAAFIYRLKH